MIPSMLKLSEDSLDWSLSHVEKLGDTDVLPTPFEYQALRHCWDDVKCELSGQDITEWHTRPLRFMLSPKGELGFRIVTQLDPLDNILLGAIIKEVGDDLEGERIDKESNKVFSYRFDPSNSGTLYSDSIGYKDFKEENASLSRKKDCNYVVVTDISDFYHRIYIHRLENRLKAYTNKSSHVTSIKRMLWGWNEKESHGIPVGSPLIHLLAEVTITDVDNALMSRSVEFTRFSDDYRIFSERYEEAYKSLNFLADILHTNHGLNLKPSKTEIIPASEFRNKYLTTPREREMRNLRRKFNLLVEGIGKDAVYSDISYKDLDKDERRIVDSMNLGNIIEDQIRSGSIDFMITKFALRRMGQIGDASSLETVIDNIESFSAVLPSVVEYILDLHSMGKIDDVKVYECGVKMYKEPTVWEMEYNKTWIVSMLVKSGASAYIDDKESMMANEPSNSVRRQLILALALESKRYWFHAHRRRLFENPTWIRRAIIRGASCLAPDAKKHWYDSIQPQLDLLETSVMRWSRANPIA